MWHTFVASSKDIICGCACFVLGKIVRLIIRQVIMCTDSGKQKEAFFSCVNAPVHLQNAVQGKQALFLHICGNKSDTASYFQDSMHDMSSRPAISS